MAIFGHDEASRENSKTETFRIGEVANAVRKLSQLVLAQVEADQVLEGTEGVLTWGSHTYRTHNSVSEVYCKALIRSANTKTQ